MKNLILASASPRRKKLLHQIGLNPRVVASSVDETFDPGLAPAEIATTLAWRKAAAVAGRLGEGLFIGADTIVAINGRILEKPDTEAEAVEMLRLLSGQTHTVISGVALILQDRSRTITGKRSFAEQVSVTFGPIAERDIERYVASGKPMDKAGAYGIQDAAGALFVEKICGDYNAVVGLPLHALCIHLKELAPDYLEKISLS